MLSGPPNANVSPQYMLYYPGYQLPAVLDAGLVNHPTRRILPVGGSHSEIFDMAHAYDPAGGLDDQAVIKWRQSLANKQCPNVGATWSGVIGRLEAAQGLSLDTSLRRFGYGLLAPGDTTYPALIAAYLTWLDDNLHD